MRTSGYSGDKSRVYKVDGYRSTHLTAKTEVPVPCNAFGGAHLDLPFRTARLQKLQDRHNGRNRT